MDESIIVVPASDGIELQVYRWAPCGSARGVVQLQHGLAEHAARYRRFATAVTDAGYLVYGPDSRGSGRTAQGDYGNWGPGGWPGWVADLDALNRRIHADTDGLPVVLMVSGTDDPVGGGEGRGVEIVAQRYRDAGIADVTVKLYPHARHEVLNETNRDEVTADVLGFIDRVVAG